MEEVPCSNALGKSRIWQKVIRMTSSAQAEKRRPASFRFAPNSSSFASIGLACLLLLGSPGAALSQHVLPEPEGTVLLRVAGDIGRTNQGDEAHFDREMIEALPGEVLETGTSVTEGVNRFEGVLMRDILDKVEANGETVVATALNDYVVEIPMEDFHDYDVIAALSMDGERLLPRDKGPIWIVYPRDEFQELQDIRYDYRWVWQLMHIEVR